MLETGNPVSALLGPSSSFGNYRNFFESSSGNSSLPLDKAVSLEKNGKETLPSGYVLTSHLHRSPSSNASNSPSLSSLHMAILETQNKQQQQQQPNGDNLSIEQESKKPKQSFHNYPELSELRNLEQSLHSWESLLHKETELIQQMKLFMNNLSKSSPQQSPQLQQHYQNLEREINSVVKMKNNIMCTFFDNSDKIQSEINIIQTQIAFPNNMLSITQQPNEVAISNRYMVPAPTVQVSPSFKPSDDNGTLIITASLFYHTDEKEIKALDGKQDVLQGITKVPLDKNGTATFTKLKITEVSSKHRHQAFCMVFSLEEYNSKGKRNIISSIKSNSFYVQSRPNKKLSTPNKRRSPDLTQPETKKSRSEAAKGDSSESDRSPCSPSSEETSHNESSYVDITDLLTLPQKNAAQHLGISESMLCKRFKECTKRKWPYRYLRKIDKVISMLKESKNGRTPQLEDKQRLEKLEQERQECLRPVKIRITVHDRLSNLKQNTSPVSSPPMPNSASQSSSDQEENCPDQEELEILETLQLLKSSSKKPL